MACRRVKAVNAEAGHGLDDGVLKRRIDKARETERTRDDWAIYHGPEDSVTRLDSGSQALGDWRCTTWLRLLVVDRRGALRRAAAAR